MANPAPGFISNRVDLVPDRRHMTVGFAGVTIADSAATLRVEETGHGAVHYFPARDVRLDLMVPTSQHTTCPFKGEASYWTIEVPQGGETRRSENAVWGYPVPYDEVSGIAGYYAFYPNRVDWISEA
ncbi:MAG TPA: DUF427 domain-containing protein [Stellaceae bacterium]|nr:DUF427 domain-containing protein [Stellaceae bacterium]